MDCLQDGRPPRSELSWDLIYFLSTISLQITKNPEPDYPITFHLATVSNQYSIGVELYNHYFFYRWSRRMARMHPMMIALSKLSSTRSNHFFKEVYHYVVGHWSPWIEWNVFLMCLDSSSVQAIRVTTPTQWCCPHVVFLLYRHDVIFSTQRSTLSLSVRTGFLPEFVTVSLDLNFGAP